MTADYEAELEAQLRLELLVSIILDAPWTNNGPGLCESHYHEIFFTNLLVRRGAYSPCFLSIEMMAGEVSVRQHLVEAHGLGPYRVSRLKQENCYRLHDLLHEKRRGGQ